MKIIDKIKPKLEEDSIFYSFEYFPPKTELGKQNLLERIERMNNNLNPLFVDMTWGAGGKTAEGTLFLSSFIQNYLQQDILMHLTCRSQSKESMDYALETCKQNNIKNLLVLRGDPPQNMNNYDSSKDPFQNAEELVIYIKKKYDDHFCICVAGYPSCHIESKDKETDLYYLKRKVDAGADFIITQLFYDADEFLEFKDECEKKDIKVPILPGILPVNNYNSFKRIIDMCKLKVPEEMVRTIEDIKLDEAKIKEYGITSTIEICKKLISKGVKYFHFYTMNLEKSTTEIINRLDCKMKKIKKELPFKSRKLPNTKLNGSKQHLQNLDKDSGNIDKIETVESKLYNLDKDKNDNDNKNTNKTQFQSSSTLETVRPVFWKNNSNSYISKTFYWDEFPNGIWGDSRSPAFGDNEEHLHTFGDQYRQLNISQTQNMIKKIGSVCSYNDLSKIFVMFLEGKIKQIPWGESSDIKEETEDIKNLLILLNQNELFTINSQPALNGCKSNDTKYGWGPSNGYIYQKLYIEFFIEKEPMMKLISMLNNNENIMYQAINNNDEKYDNFEDEPVVCAITWGCFPKREIIQPTIYDSEIFCVWKQEAFEKFDSWANCIKTEEEEKENVFLQNAKNELFLMTIVDNDYITPSVQKILMEFIDSKNKK
jgi:methylenetetrahydrofolate reductase (NADPH)